MLSLCYYKVLIIKFNNKVLITLLLPTGNLLFSGKQRISLSTKFPLHVNEGKFVDKEILCVPLNFRCISYACGKFRRQRKNSPLAWAMREIRGLHSLEEQKNPRRSWYYTEISSCRKPYTSFINLNIFIGITFIVPTNILRPHPAVNPTTFVDLSTFVGFDRYRRQYSLRRLFSKPNSQSLYICFYRIPYNILA